MQMKSGFCRVWLMLRHKLPFSKFVFNDTLKIALRNDQESQETTQISYKNFEYTTIADRLWAISWSNSHPSGVVKPIHWWPTFLNRNRLAFLTVEFVFVQELYLIEMRPIHIPNGFPNIPLSGLQKRMRYLQERKRLITWHSDITS